MNTFSFASFLALIAAAAAAVTIDDEHDSTILDLHKSFLSADALNLMKRRLRGGGGGMMMGRGMHHHEHMHGGDDEHMMHGGGGGGDDDEHMMMMMQDEENHHQQHMGLTDDEHEVIMALFDHRHEIQRTPVEIENGYNITTVSDNTRVAQLIQEHVHSMTQLKQNGRRVRQCDRLFRALFDHMDETSMEVEYLEDVGVHVTHSGKTPCGEVLVGDHTRTVSRFVDTGNMRPDFHWTPPEVCQKEPDVEIVSEQDKAEEREDE
jgi:hypothetical protein